MPQFYLPDHFLKQLKPYSKKFRKLETDLIVALRAFSPAIAQHLGHKLYKLRLKASDFPRGKSKSFRLIIFLWHDPELVVPIAIYFKGDIKNLSPKEIEFYLKLTIRELELINRV